MMVGIIIGLRILVIMALSALVHELGHALMLKHYTGRDITIRYNFKYLLCGKKEDYTNLNSSQYKLVVWAGVLPGLLTIFMFLPSLHIIEGLPILFFYIVGCWSDLKIILGDINEED